MAGVSVRLPTETVSLAELRPHPANYRTHPPDQLTHVEESLRAHGQYRAVVVAKDNTILAGHGVAEAARNLGWEELEVTRVDYDPFEPRAVKLLVADNEISRMADVDDRKLADHLAHLVEMAEGSDDAAQALLGTGFDPMMLANLLAVTRSPGEITDTNETEIWGESGMPEYEAVPRPPQIVVSFKDEETRDRFVAQAELEATWKQAHLWSGWFPSKGWDDTTSLRFDA